MKPHWIVLDKFEKHPGVINEDIEFFKPKKKFQFIFSISTFEHIGKDDDRNDPEKLSRCISNIIDHCLAPAGRLVATAPLGYNHQLDSLIFQNMLGCSACYFLQRTSWSNEWKQIELTDITAAGYCWPYNNASVIAVMEWGNFSRTQR